MYLLPFDCERRDSTRRYAWVGILCQGQSSTWWATHQIYLNLRQITRQVELPVYTDDSNDMHPIANYFQIISFLGSSFTSYSVDSGHLPLVRNSAAQMDRMVHNTIDPAPAHTLGFLADSPEGTGSTSSDAWFGPNRKMEWRLGDTRSASGLLLWNFVGKVYEG